MRNDVTVGVRTLAEDFGPAAEVQQHWVRIGDVTLTAADHNLVGVSYGPETAGGFSLVTIKLHPSSFASVPFDATEPAPPDSSLEEAIEKVLVRYGLPPYGYPLSEDTLMPSRGDLTSDIADAVRTLLS